MAQEEKQPRAGKLGAFFLPQQPPQAHEWPPVAQLALNGDFRPLMPVARLEWRFVLLAASAA